MSVAAATATPTVTPTATPSAIQLTVATSLPIEISAPIPLPTPVSVGNPPAGPRNYTFSKLGMVGIGALVIGVTCIGSVLNRLFNPSLGSKYSKAGAALAVGLATAEAFAPILKRSYKIVKEHGEQGARDTETTYQMSGREMAARSAVSLGSFGLTAALDYAITGTLGNVTLASAVANFGNFSHMMSETFFRDQNISRAKRIAGQAIVTLGAMGAAIGDRLCDATGRTLVHSGLGQAFGKFAKRHVKQIGEQEKEDKENRWCTKIATVAKYLGSIIFSDVAMGIAMGALVKENFAWRDPRSYIGPATFVGAAKALELILIGRTESKKNTRTRTAAPSATGNGHAHAEHSTFKLTAKKLAKFAAMSFGLGLVATGCYNFARAGFISPETVEVGSNLIYRLANWQYVIKPLFKKVQSSQGRAAVVATGALMPCIAQSLMGLAINRTPGDLGSWLGFGDIASNVKIVALSMLARPITKALVERFVLKPKVAGARAAAGAA